MLTEKQVLDSFGREPHGFQDLLDLIVHFHKDLAVVLNLPWILNAARMTISRNSAIQNTHFCPRGGVTNWSGESGKPRSYPGCKGTMWLSYHKNLTHGCQYDTDIMSDIDIFAPLPIHATYCKITKINMHGQECNILGVEFLIFDADWPQLYHDHLFDILGNNFQQKQEYISPGVHNDTNRNYSS